MFWTGFIIGLFVGANVGVVIAGMLLSAKARDKVQSQIANKDPAESHSSINETINQDSCPTASVAAQFQNEDPDRKKKKRTAQNEGIKT